MVPALPSSALDGYETSFNNQQHVNFVGAVGNEFHVFELYYDGGWHLNDLTVLAGAPSPALYSPLSGYETTFNHQQHVNFVGGDGHVHDLYYDGGWHHNDLSQLTGAPPFTNFGGGLHGYVTSFNKQQHVNFIGDDFHVHELYYDGAWHHNDLTQLTGAPLAGERVNPGVSSWASAVDGYETSFNNQQHVNFIGVDLHVHELYYDGAWHHNDLTQLAGAPNPVAIFTLDGYETSFKHQQHVNFVAVVGNDFHVFELYYDGAWHWNDLTHLAGAPPFVGPNPLVGYVTWFNNQQHVNFTGFSGKDVHVFELYYDGAWHHNDLTQLAGAPPFTSQQNRRGLDGYVTTFNNRQHVNYLGNDLHVHELYYDGAWHHNDLTAIAK